MVESKVDQGGDGVNRPIKYATFRTDKDPEPGYSAELISDRVEAQYYGDLDARPRPME